MKPSLCLLLAGILLSATSPGAVIINEIMYHPPSENDAEEFIELLNTGSTPVDLSGCQFTNGIGYTVPSGTAVPAGGYLVVAADAAAFHAKYPTVTNYIGGWAGHLSNSSNRITLKSSLGATLDEVEYSDDGDWSVRQKDEVPDYGHRGWGWKSPADGFGKSLELVNPGFDNNCGQNWRASLVDGGTPGTANTVAAPDIAPFILSVEHFPLRPRSDEPVSITAQVVDDHGSPITATLHYQNDGVAGWSTASMLDDGVHGDGIAGDGTFGVVLPVQNDGTIVEFYVEAADNASHSRNWPAPGRDENGAVVQETNCLYQVDNGDYAGSQPYYHLVMKVADRAELEAINDYPEEPEGSPTDQSQSHARFNTTFISRGGSGTKLCYLSGTRNRGHGSRTANPQSYNVAFTNADPWNDAVSVNLNSQYTPYQVLGSALYRKAGLAMGESRAVQVRMNGANLAFSGSPSFGYYVANESVDSEFCDHHFPLDSSGNLYRAKRRDELGGADLRDQSTHASPALADPTPYRVNYFKETNASEDRWADLIGLTQVLAKGHSQPNYSVTYDADFLPATAASIDINQWMRFMAVNTIADNSETNISMGDGDDYFLYFGKDDPRSKFIAYDVDTILGRSGTTNSATHNIFRMSRSTITGNPPAPIHPLLLHPQYAPIYFRELKRALDGAFAPAQFDPLVDQVLLANVPDPNVFSVIQAIKTFNVQRTTYVASQLPTAIGSIGAQNNAGTALTIQNGYPRTTETTCRLVGKANCLRTANVTVNGLPATYTPWKVTATNPFTTSVGDWSVAGIALSPGLNRILIKAFDSSSIEIEQSSFDVWYDDSTVQNVSGTLAAGTTSWTRAAGPYQVTAALTVPNGSTLSIEAGTTVYLAAGVGITVSNGGKIVAEGTESQRIRFALPPAGTGSWGQITINGGAGSPETRIAYADFSSNSGPALQVTGGTVYFDHLNFLNNATEYMHLDGAAFVVSNCNFPAGSVGFEGVHGTGGVKAGGYGIFRHCYFGPMIGYNDVVDFTGGNRNQGQPIIQFINNVFTGNGDDLLDLDGTDAWVEGNIFMHCHKNGAPDSSSAVSGGNTGADTSDITILHNLFFDCDHALTAKQGNYYTLIGNTIVHTTKTGGLDIESGVLNMQDAIPAPPTTYGLGCYVEGNIVVDCEQLVRNYSAAESTVTFNNNILPQAWAGPGSGNQVIDPRLNYIPQLSETNFTNWNDAQIMRTWFGLQPGSPAIGTGPNGRDKGGAVPTGASISGQPKGTTNLNSATLVVGDRRTGFGMPTGGFPLGSGFTHYKWQLDGGAWSAETAIDAPISLAGLSTGSHAVNVVGKNDAGFYQNDPAFGADGSITNSGTWIVDPGYVPPAPQPLVQINEVLAKNTATISFGGNFPDIIELHNAGGASADLSGWGLTDNNSLPYKYTFPSGTTLGPDQYLVIYASSSGSVPSPKTGFGLKDGGDTVTLTKSASQGGGVADAVPFGAQLPDVSAGRRATDRVWDMCVPTFGSANIVAAQGPVSTVKINEWLADAASLAPQDFIELYNPSAFAVNIGNGYLTDNPIDWPTKHQIRPLTFVAAGGYLVFKADSDPGQGPDHLNFKLAPEQGEIGLFSSAGALIDNIVYGPQTTDISEGRTPNGAAAISFFNQPTPGAPNPGSTGNVFTQVNVIPVDKVWKYQSSSADVSATFYNPAFNDASWASGGQLLYIETSALTSASGFVKTTGVPADASNSNRPFNTTYFRTHFNYSGPTTGVFLLARMMIDDGCVIYLNGQEIVPNTGARIRMPTGTVAFSTIASGSIDNATEEGFVFANTPLQNGDNVIAVAVHQQHTGATQSSSDVVFGLKLDVSVPTGTSPVVINEVLPINSTFQNPDGSFHGWIELYNTGDLTIDISDMSLTPSIGSPRAYVFAPGTTVAGHAYLVVQCNPAAPASPTNTGFSLSGVGGGAYLFRKLTDGGGLQDSVSYGGQVADFSLGRLLNGLGLFALSVPTRSALNQSAALGAIGSVRLNEWATSSSQHSSWLELFNGGSLPVPIGGNYLTDSLGNKTKFLIPELSYLGGGGTSRWRQYIADNDNTAQAGHVNFSLSEGEAIGLFSGSGAQLDIVSIASVDGGSTQGRFPDGSATIIAMPPTPAAMNATIYPDSDSDGIPDAWETFFGFNPNNGADATADPDGDGRDNLSEYRSGTDPLDAGSVFAAKVIRGPAAGQWTVQFSGTARRTYSVWYKDQLSAAPWTKLTDVTAPSANTVVSVVDPNPSGVTQRFYQVSTPSTP